MSSCASTSTTTTEAPAPAASSPSNPDPIVQVASQTATTVTAQSAKFEAWKQTFIRSAVQQGYDSNVVTALIMPAVINEKALDRDQNQPEFTKPIWSYIDNARSAERVNNGRAKLAENADVMAQIEGRYRVPRAYLTAIWGLESAYGRIMGTDNIVSSLSTFAFDGRRQKFGNEQLMAVLDLVQSRKVRPDQLVGSWAGAMGMTQFIPTTFRDYAVDFDGNGNIDMWTNTGDALGSAAHYLSRHGWQWGQPAMTEVVLPDGFDYALSDNRKMTVSQWAGLGVRPNTGFNWPQNEMELPAKLLVPAGHKGPKFLTFKNFDVIKRYNNSTSYAMGITALAMTLDGQSAIRAPWPVDDAPLSFSDKKLLQQRLTEQGYDTNGVDGKLGPNSLKAIRKWQADHGFIADGYVEQSLFRRIVKS